MTVLAGTATASNSESALDANLTFITTYRRIRCAAYRDLATVPILQRHPDSGATASRGVDDRGDHSWIAAEAGAGMR
jgi:hypothetical protein